VDSLLENHLSSEECNGHCNYDGGSSGLQMLGD